MPTGRRAAAHTRMWRHPFNRRIEVPHQVATAVAVLAAGIVDRDVIAAATGLTLKEVESVDQLKDRTVRSLWKAGIPRNQYFKLHRTIRCPRCNSRITVAPCVACAARSLAAEA